MAEASSCQSLWHHSATQLLPAPYEITTVEIEDKKKYGYKSKDSTRAALQEQDGETKVGDLLVNFTDYVLGSHPPRVSARVVISLGAID